MNSCNAAGVFGEISDISDFHGIVKCSEMQQLMKSKDANPSLKTDLATLGAAHAVSVFMNAKFQKSHFVQSLLQSVLPSVAKDKRVAPSLSKV